MIGWLRRRRRGIGRIRSVRRHGLPSHPGLPSPVLGENPQQPSPLDRHAGGPAGTVTRWSPGWISDHMGGTPYRPCTSSPV